MILFNKDTTYLVQSIKTVSEINGLKISLLKCLFVGLVNIRKNQCPVFVDQSLF